MQSRILVAAASLLAVAAGIGVLVAAAPPREGAIAIDAVDRDILEQRLLIGRSDLIDPDHFLPWTLSFVVPPAPIANDPITIAYFRRWRALADAFQSVARERQDVFRNINRRLVRDLGPLPNLYDLRERAFFELAREGIIRAIIRRADSLCPRAREVPSVYRTAPLAAWGKQRTGIVAYVKDPDTSYRCSHLFNYCPGKGIVMHTFGNALLEECLRAHQALLLHDAEYRAQVARYLTPLISRAKSVNPSNAEEISELKHRLVAALEEESSIGAKLDQEVAKSTITAAAPAAGKGGSTR
ncbi:hypothetical protein D6833_14025 [Candidatus Parcubacteria bacterium]|nr:MAG: hypothetical protein D6833_14025 [Candidatus Parcubacteria bacterium]